MQCRRRAELLRRLRELAQRDVDTSHLEGAEAGFTLIELMVVLLIMAILMAIAIPTFLGVRSGAQERSAQSDLTNAVISAKTVFTNSGTFATTASLVSNLQSSEPELSFTSALVAANGKHAVSVAVSVDGAIIVLSDQSQDSRCWYAEANEESTATSNGMANATASQGVSYNGTRKGFQVTLSCGWGDTYLGTANASGWGPTYPQ